MQEVFGENRMVSDKPIRKSVSVMVPVTLQMQFRRILLKQGRKQNETVEALIREYCLHHTEAINQSR